MLGNSEKLGQSYDPVIAGSGIGSLFFLNGSLKRFPKARCLLLEWGGCRDADWQVANQKNGHIDPQQTFTTRPYEKPRKFLFRFAYRLAGQNFNEPLPERTFAFVPTNGSATASVMSCNASA